MTWTKRRPLLIPCLIAAAMSFVAIADLPYGYYTLMRLVVCATAVLVIVVAAKSKQMWTVWAFSILVLLFNPIVPVHLTKGLWQPLDLITGVLLIVAALVIRQKPPAEAA